MIPFAGMTRMAAGHEGREAGAVLSNHSSSASCSAVWTLQPPAEAISTWSEPSYWLVLNYFATGDAAGRVISITPSKTLHTRIPPLLCTATAPTREGAAHTWPLWVPPELQQMSPGEEVDNQKVFFKGEKILEGKKKKKKTCSYTAMFSVLQLERKEQTKQPTRHG